MSAKSDIHILVLDDEPFMLKLLAQQLTNLGFTDVATCDNGQTALERVDDATHVPQLILCDLNMPGMDGMEFVRKLVEHRYTGSLILVSGEDERTLESARTLVQAHHIEVLGSLHKPVSPQALSDLVERWVPPPAWPSAFKAKGTAQNAWHWLSRGESWSITTNPKSRCRAARWSAWRPWCGGGTPVTAWSTQTSSSAWPRPMD